MSLDITKAVNKITYNGAELPLNIPTGMIDGTLETFNAGGAEIVAPYRCYQFANLKSVDLTGVKEVGDYAFNGCTNVENLVLGEDIIRVNQRSFYNVSSNYGISIGEFTPRNECYVGDDAFSNTQLKRIIGNFNYIGSSGFSSNVLVEELNVGGICTFIGASAFRGIGATRTNPENNIFKLNFKNGVFTTIASSTFAGTGSGVSSRVKYMEIRLPATLKTISTQTFRYSDHLNIYFYGNPATLVSDAFSNSTNLKIFVPFTKINAYRTATNWSAQSANIRGFADAGTFAQGQKLPMYNSEGYALTWYSDKELTQVVTEVADPEAEYYCTAGTEKVAVSITRLYANGVDLIVSDGATQYYQDYGVPIGTTLTITATPKVSGHIPYQFTLNGETITSGATYTTVADTDIKIIAIYWDGINVPANPIFAENDWHIIKTVAQAGVASDLGWAVGDTKEILIEGVTYNIRIADMQLGRYNYTNSTKTTNMVFELVEILKTTRRMNATNTNVGGWAESEMRKTLNGLEGGQANILSTLPQDLQEVLEEVQIKSADTGATGYTITESANKLFLLSYAEVFNTTTSQYLLEGSRYDYYIQNDSDAARVKKRNNSAGWWWLRSPYSGITGYFYGVGNYGSGSSNGAFGSSGVSFGFAF